MQKQQDTLHVLHKKELHSKKIQNKRKKKLKSVTQRQWQTCQRKDKSVPKHTAQRINRARIN